MSDSAQSRHDRFSALYAERWDVEAILREGDDLDGSPTLDDDPAPDFPLPIAAPLDDDQATLAELLVFVSEARTYASSTAAPVEEPWQRRAACAGQHQLMDNTSGEAVYDALRLCFGCPVLQQCRAWADSETYLEGVAGGELYTRGVKTKERLLGPDAIDGLGRAS